MSREQFEQLVTVPEWAAFDPVHGYSNPEWQDLDPATNFVRLDELSRINAAWKAYQSRQSEIDALHARIAALEAQLADYRENGGAAVRHAPASAHWSRELRRLFGDDARAGIDKIEAQVRTAGAIPVKSFVVISEDEDVIEVPDTDLGQALLMLEVARDEEPDKAWSLQAEVDADEARRLRGEALGCPRCKGTGSVCTGTIEGVPELFDCDKCGGEGKLRAVPQAQGQGGEG